jgi:hypothetical protein
LPWLPWLPGLRLAWLRGLRGLRRLLRTLGTVPLVLSYPSLDCLCSHDGTDRLARWTCDRVTLG